jgi:cell division protease FtsH
VLLVVGLLALNVFISQSALQPTGRVQVPYYPTFVDEVTHNNVVSISSTGQSIQGTFKNAVTYPPTSKTAQPATQFSTQIPSFANNNELYQLLSKHSVTINAHPVQNNPSVISELLFGFGPTILFVLLLVWFMRRAAAAGGAGGLMGFGRSRARRVEAQDQHVTFKDVAGIDEAKEELTEIVDFL